MRCLSARPGFGRARPGPNRRPRNTEQASSRASSRAWTRDGPGACANLCLRRMAARTSPVLQLLQPESGGVPAHVLALGRGLRARGWPVEVATCATSEIRAGLEEAGIPVHVLPFSGTPGRFDARDVRAGPA